jgi:hypothetical protein
MATITVGQSGSPTYDYDTLEDALDNASASDTISIEGSWTVDDSVGGGACVATVDNLTITADSSARHNGKYDTSDNHYRLVADDSGGHALTVNSNLNITIENIVIELANSTNSAECIRFNSGSTARTLTCNNVIFCTESNVSDQDGVYCSNDCLVNLTNCIAYGFGRAAFHPQSYGGYKDQEWHLNSCTVWNCARYASEGDGGAISVFSNTGNAYEIYIYNCCFAGAGVDAESEDINVWAVGLAMTGAIDRSIYNSITAFWTDDVTPTDCVTSLTVDDSDNGTGDYLIYEDITTWPYDLRLQDLGNSKNKAQDMHADNSGPDSMSIGTDIIGTSRPQNTNYDCGAFEIVAAGGTTVQIAQAAIGMAAQALGVNAKQNLAVSQASVGYAGVGVNANAKTQTEIASAAIGYTSQALNTNAKTMLAIAQSAISYAGQLVSTGSETIVSIANAAIGYAGQAVTVNAKTIIAIAAAGISKAGQSVVTNMINVVGIVNAAITLAGQTFKINKVVHIGAATINAIGRGVTASVGGVVTEIKRRSKWLAGFVVRRKR